MLVRTMPPFILVFLTLVYKVSCQGASLTFVIDSTHSMVDDIAYVIKEVDSILKIVLDEKSSQISNIILITFNDPGPPKLQVITRNSTVLIKALKAVPIDGGRADCPELALSGVKLALESSLPGSYIYVFTDASAKDYYMNEEIQQLRQRKQSQIQFMLTGSCGDPLKSEFQVYYNITTASVSPTIMISKPDVGTVLKKFVEEDIQDDRSLLTTQLVPPNVRTKIPFWIDDLTKYAVITASGMNVHMNHYDATYSTIDSVIFMKHLKAVKVRYGKPGEYSVTVKSVTSVTNVVVTVTSDFNFLHGFSELQPKSLKYTTPQPISDKKTRLSFLVTDPTFSVRIKTAQILDLKENIIENKEFPLTELWPNFYVTEPFMAPSHMFKVALTGEVIQTGNPVRRLAKIPVVPQKSLGTPVAKTPAVEIMEGASVEVARGSSLTLTCKVSAYPEPQITWTNGKTTLPANSSRVQIPYDYISYLVISNATEARYYCIARNLRDSAKYYKVIDVIIKDPFITKAVPKGTTNVAYGTEVTLNCDVRSSQPLQIFWYRVNKLTSETEHVSPSEKYSIFSNGTQLKITSMDLDMVGKYTCKVVLQGDPTQKREFSTNVEIHIPPKIYNKYQMVIVKEHAPATIECKIIEGLPEPNISWLMKATDSTEYRPITGLDSEFHIEQATQANGGHYKCVAENVVGRREQVVGELVVLKSPSVAIVEGASIEVPYGSPLTLECRVKANPEPTVKWTDSAGNTLKSMSSDIKIGFEYSHILRRVNVKKPDNYSCNATNDQGSITKSIRMTVSSPFKVNSHPPDTVSSKYGTRVNLKCNITSNMPMEIRWYYRNNSKSENKELKTKKPYMILANGAELEIGAMDIGLDGEYTCKAFLSEDRNEHVERTTHVSLVGLVAPKIDTEIQTVKVLEHKRASIKCKILEGVPKPKISWQMMRIGSMKYQFIAGSGSELSIEQAALANGGHYKCVAENVVGHREQVVGELVVLKSPAVAIVEGASIEVPYGNRLTLECRVTANPEPTVMWTDSAGNTLKSMSSSIKIGFEYSHILTRVNVKKPDNYSCNATNDQGSITKSIRMTVSSPFKVNSHPPDTISSEYGTRVNLKCNITSYMPMEIRWYYRNNSKSENKELKTKKPYMILANGAELEIGAMDIGLDGEYTCKAFLSEDRNEHVERTTHVSLVGLVAPKIDTEIQTVKVLEHKRASIRCKILEGVPKPEITWQMLAAGSKEYQFIAGSGSELSIEQAALANGGHYKCIADNVVGRREQVVGELVVLKSPAVAILEGASIEVPYGSPLTLECRVKANPEPTVKWTDSAGNTLKSMSSDIKIAFEYSHILTRVNVKKPDNYSCNATNDQGSITKSIRVSVASPFKVNSHPPDTISSEYGTRVNLECNITSYMPMEIRWYYRNNSKSENKELKTKKPYMILANGAELEIGAMDIGLDGEYTCKAFLSEDRNEHVERTTHVSLVGLVAPKIDTEIQTVKVLEHKRASIKCKILEGVPKPELTWQMLADGSKEYHFIAGSGSELSIEQAALANGGHYKCVAENVVGRRKQVVGKLVVLKSPAVAIVEGASIEVPYGNRLTLECRVTANPEPTVLWTDSTGNTLNSMISGVNIGFEYIHILTRVNVRKSDNYSCSAINDQGSIAKIIRVSVSSPFNVNSYPPDSMSIRFGTQVNFKCNITSKFPMEIRWYHASNSKSEKREIKPTVPYTILSNGAELKISKMAIGLDGEYTCKAFLLEDPDEHLERTTQVQIVGLVPPKIDTEIRNEKVLEHMPVAIKCKILEGVPKPTISWQLKAAGSTVYRSIAGSSSELHIEQTALAHDGLYKCVTENAVGRRERIVAKLVVLKAPAVKIVEGAGMAVPYGSRVTLECHVTANPEPTVAWKDGAGNTLPAVSSAAKNGFDYTYIITRPNVKASDNLSCSAINDQGAENKSVQVTVSSAFMVYSHFERSVSGKYKTEVSLKCNITSKLPMQILWYHKGLSKEKKEIATSQQYTILSNGAELKINSMDVGLEGEYTCNAFLKEDPDEQVGHTTRVIIDGLVPPEINSVYETIKTREHTLAIIKCIIVAGVPEPTISWQMKATYDNSTEYRSITGTGSELRIEQVALANSGYYKCVAENAVGRRERVVGELVVLKSPAVTIVEGASIEVPYGSRLTLECHVTANPKPTVVWTDSAGNTLHDMSSAALSVFGYTHFITRVNMKASDNFTCSAKNEQGSFNESIRVSVSSPFTIVSYPPDLISAKYGTEVNLKCNVTSLLPMEIQWYYTKHSTLKKEIIKATGPYTILANGAELKISVMDTRLFGEYTCKASLLKDSDENVEHTSYVQIVGLEVPEVTIIGNENVRSGKPILMKCNVIKGVPKPTLRWQFKAFYGKEFTDMNNTSSEWYRSKATSEDAGFYKCTARNSQGTRDHVLMLTVEEPARIITNKSVYEGITDDIALKIPCDTIGNPEPTVSWEVNNAPAIPGNQYDIEDGALIIKNPTASISNYTYNCIARNEIGSDNKTFKAYVVDILTDYGVRHRINLIEHRSIELTCQLPRTAASTVKWFINGHDTYVNKTSFTINDAEVGIDGNYTCHVSDVHGSASETYVVEVGYPPTFKYEDQGPVVHWSGNKDDDLRCDVEARPYPDIKWLFNGKTLVGKESYNLNIFKWGIGNYTCIIKNLHGEVQRNFEVKTDIL